MRVRSFLVLILVVLVLSAASPALAAEPGTLTIGVHVTLVNRWLEPAEVDGLITPFMVLYLLHDALVKPMAGTSTRPAGLRSEPGKAALAEAGYPNGFDAGDLTPLPPYTSLGEAVANYLQPIGIRTRVRTMERAAFISGWREKKLKGLVIGATGAAGNAAARLESFVTKTGIYAYRTAPDLEDLYLRQAKELDRKQREALLHQLQKAVTDRVLTAPIFQQAFLCGVGPRADEAAVGLIQGFPYSGPAVDLKLKP